MIMSESPLACYTFHKLVLCIEAYETIARVVHPSLCDSFVRLVIST
jgi:hypothetical protein